MTAITVYHNPKCGTSRNTLAMIRNSGVEPEVIEYLKTPPDRATLVALIAATGEPVINAVRTKEAIFTELQLDAPGVTDAQLIDAMLQHPILINRPIVVTPLGTRLCRPSEKVLDMLPAPMARDLGVTTPTVFAAFSVALIVSALLGPFAGRGIDRHGGRPVLVGTNLLFAASLVGMALAQGPVGLFAAWVLMGVAMGSGLYEAAFATLVRLYGQGARGAITGITLIAGFASTVGWPLSAWMEMQWGWRGAWAGWAALHLLVGVPLNGWLPRADAADKAPEPSTDAIAAPTTEPAVSAPPT